MLYSYIPVFLKPLCEWLFFGLGKGIALCAWPLFRATPAISPHLPTSAASDLEPEDFRRALPLASAISGLPNLQPRMGSEDSRAHK